MMSGVAQVIGMKPTLRSLFSSLPLSSAIASGQLVFLPVAAWLSQNWGWRAALIFVIAALGAEALDALLKLLFRRPRPVAFFGYAQPLTYSFPSGHSVVSCCFYGVAAAILTARMRSPAPRILACEAADASKKLRLSMPQ